MFVDYVFKPYSGSEFKILNIAITVAIMGTLKGRT